MNYTTRIKSLLARILPDAFQLQYIAYLPQFGKWIDQYGKSCSHFDSKLKLYNFVNNNYGNNPIDYLEFGVWYGGSMKEWIKINNNPDSRFYGFDTFTGLPEVWQGFTKNAAEHTFTAHGDSPDISDSRVIFVKGLFQNTLNDFFLGYPVTNQLIMHIDSDIYSSALFVLTKCDPIIRAGTVIIFDEFSSVMDEFRALNDYCSAYRRSYEVIGTAGQYYDQVAIKML